MVDILNEQIHKLQFEYLEILKSAKRNISSENQCAVIDEIMVFWKRSAKLVSLIMNYLSMKEDTYIFTGAVFLDIDDNEHYPFVSIGKKHILDDPLCRFFDIAEKLNNTEASEGFYSQALLTLDDNIKVIETCFPHIIILPLRFLSDIDNEIVQKGSMDAFFSMFSTVKTFEDYMQLCTIEDIYNALLPGVAEVVIFDIREDLSVDFIERFNSFVSKEKELPYPDNKVTTIFFFTIIGYISQAIDILLMCSVYECIPYIRYEVAFKYLMRMAQNFLDINGIHNVVFKSSVSYILYNHFDKLEWEHVTISEYIKIVEKNGGGNRIFDLLKDQGITSENAKMQQIIDSTIIYMEELRQQKNNI